MLQTFTSMAHLRKHFERQEANTLLKTQRGISPSDTTTLRSVYRLQTGSQPILGYQIDTRSSTSRSKLFYHADLFRRTPPMGWITYKITFPKIHQKTAQVIKASDSEILYVRRIWGEIIPSALSRLSIRHRFPR